MALRDPVTGLDLVGEDGHSLVVSAGFVNLTLGAASCLLPNQTGAWTPEGYWPSARAFDDIRLPASIDEIYVALAPQDFGTEPPHNQALSPADLDILVAGSLSEGPWAGFMSVAWPPAEPDGEEEGAADLSAEPDRENSAGESYDLIGLGDGDQGPQPMSLDEASAAESADPKFAPLASTGTPPATVAGADPPIPIDLVGDGSATDVEAEAPAGPKRGRKAAVAKRRHPRRHRRKQV